MHFMPTTDTKKTRRKTPDNRPPLSQLRERAALSLDEFASLFGRRKNWAYRLVWTGKIRVIKPAGEMMIPQSEVQRLTAEPIEYDAIPSAAA
jgi:Helix-turn-helix domain